MDVLLFDGFDATFKHHIDMESSDALRALGLSTSTLIERSKQLPAMVMQTADSHIDSGTDDRGTWALWGGRESIFAALAEVFDAYGLKPRDSSVVYWVEKAGESYFLRLAISELLSLSQARYAAMRDSARKHHARYRVKHLKQLRSNLLSQSLDLSSIDRDIRRYNERGWRVDRAKFRMEDADWVVDKRGPDAWKPINLNKLHIKRQTQMLDSLAVADREYREILTSVASLTSSMRSLRAGTIALWVALASLVVAGMTLLLTDASAHTQLDVILDWLRTWTNTIREWLH
ncbi:hypothetical protein A5722_25515 [Mycobacterium vulneris]|nr:hypothetical protein A5722_25515 [Mycolicibacterium vulneris]OCB63974.1 hypothetical protein A5729_22865 [Mycolicibacterium vulneris]